MKPSFEQNDFKKNIYFLINKESSCTFCEFLSKSLHITSCTRCSLPLTANKGSPYKHQSTTTDEQVQPEHMQPIQKKKLLKCMLTISTTPPHHRELCDRKMQLLTVTVEHMTNQPTDVNLRRHAKPTRLNDSQQDQYVKLPLEAIY